MNDSSLEEIPQEENPLSSETPNDEELRKVLKPAPSEEQVLAILKEHYADADAKILAQLDSYDDCNFKVDVDGTAYVLKIHNGVESQDLIKTIGEKKRFYKAGQMSSVIHYQHALLELFKEHNIPSNLPVLPKAEKEKKLGAPFVIASLPVISDSHSPAQLVVRLLTWIEGRPMSDVKVYSLEVLAETGRFLGKVDKALDQLNFNSLSGAIDKVGSSAALLGRRGSMLMPSAPSPARHKSLSAIPPVDHMENFDFAAEGVKRRRRSSSVGQFKSLLGIPEDSPSGPILDQSLFVAARRYHQWDGKNSLDLRKFVDYILDDKRRGLVVSVLDAFEKEIIQSGASSKFRKGINHADFNDANILLDQDLKVCGVIDFGDSVESWRVLEISVAMAYAMVSNYGKGNRSLSAAAGMLRGYHAVYPLSSTERKHLQLLMAVRLACSATLGAYSRRQNPDNKYLLLHAEPAWKALELIWPHDEEEREKLRHAVGRLFEQACLYSDPRETIVTCYDLEIPDPGVADLLEAVRVTNYDVEPPPRKKQKTEENGDKKQSSEIPPITFVTGNAKKLEEVERILKSSDDDGKGPFPFTLTSHKVDLPELQGEPFVVAREKCIEAAKKVGGPVITEDTSLCFHALNNLPGIYIKWFLESCGHDGLNKMLDGFEDKTAYAQTIVAMCLGPDKEPIIFDGRTMGKIVPARGKLDFGWDPIFEPNEGGGKTYAEMSKDEKDAISHRSRAFKQLRDYMNKFRADVIHQMTS